MLVMAVAWCRGGRGSTRLQVLRAECGNSKAEREEKENQEAKFELSARLEISISVIIL